jgi:4-amino-4-deoxy-L-arabinose transferase-like glycosyltransferase
MSVWWGRVTPRLRSVPLAAWLCALIACLNAVSWSFVSPPFQVPDEHAHFAYVERLARTGHLPTSSAQEFPLDEQVALQDLEVARVSLQPNHHPIGSEAKQRTLEHEIALAVGLSPPPGDGPAGAAASEPPLYYAIEAIPYDVGASGGVLDQIALMRLVSALMAGLTSLFAFMFLLEALPSAPGTWTVGGLAVAFMPALGFISGAVNPDAMLCAVSGAVFYCLARAFHRGLTPRLAIAIGAFTAIGFLTKLNFLGLFPGVGLGLVLLAKRASRAVGARSSLRMLATALAIALSPACAYVAINLLRHRHALGLGSSVITFTVSHRSIASELSYVWQLYLPRLPGMHTDFADISPLRDLWFNGLVGEYGFEDTFFPRWVENLALVPAACIVALAAREAFAHRFVVSRRVGELSVYLAMAVGLLALIGASSFLSYPSEAAGFPEPRYLLPLLPLFAAVLALAIRGTGRRWQAASGVLIVALFIAHDVFSQLQVIARFYG